MHNSKLIPILSFQISLSTVQHWNDKLSSKGFICIYCYANWIFQLTGYFPTWMIDSFSSISLAFVSISLDRMSMNKLFCEPFFHVKLMALRWNELKRTVQALFAHLRIFQPASLADSRFIALAPCLVVCGTALSEILIDEFLQVYRVDHSIKSSEVFQGSNPQGRIDFLS